MGGELRHTLIEINICSSVLGGILTTHRMYSYILSVVVRVLNADSRLNIMNVLVVVLDYFWKRYASKEGKKSRSKFECT